MRARSGSTCERDRLAMASLFSGQPQGLQGKGDRLRKDREPKVSIALLALKDVTEVMHSHQLPPGRRATAHQSSTSQVRESVPDAEARTPMDLAGLQVQKALSPTTSRTSAAQQTDGE